MTLRNGDAISPKQNHALKMKRAHKNHHQSSHCFTFPKPFLPCRPISYSFENFAYIVLYIVSPLSILYVYIVDKVTKF